MALAEKKEQEIFQLTADLYSEENKSSELVCLKFPAMPLSFQEVVSEIERVSSIPSCSQTVLVQGSVIQNLAGTKPSSYYLQSGDTIKVSYPTKYQSDQVKTVVEWIERSTSLLDDLYYLEEAEAKERLKKLNAHLDSLALQFKLLNEDLLYPWYDSVKDLNCWYFNKLGGTTLLMRFYQVLKSLEKFAAFKKYATYFQVYISCILGMMARSQDHCREITKAGGLDYCIAIFKKTLQDNSVQNVGASLQGLGK